MHLDLRALLLIEHIVDLFDQVEHLRGRDYFLGDFGSLAKIFEIEDLRPFLNDFNFVNCGAEISIKVGCQEL